MSQIASFTYLAAAHVPMIGFWSKPKPRLFRSPESKFQDYLREKALRTYTFERADGVYVALVFAWLQYTDSNFGKDADLVLTTVRRHTGGSHWLLVYDDRQWLQLLNHSLSENALAIFLEKIGRDLDWVERNSFDLARQCVGERIAEIAPNESLLISVG